jgi:hypothetical protein
MAGEDRDFIAFAGGEGKSEWNGTTQQWTGAVWKAADGSEITGTGSGWPHPRAGQFMARKLKGAIPWSHLPCDEPRGSARANFLENEDRQKFLETLGAGEASQKTGWQIPYPVTMSTSIRCGPSGCGRSEHCGINPGAAIWNTSVPRGGVPSETCASAG